MPGDGCVWGGLMEERQREGGSTSNGGNWDCGESTWQEVRG